MMTKRYWPENRRVSDEGAIPQVWLWWVVDTQTRKTVREGHAASGQEALEKSVAHARTLNDEGVE
jgi:hypothetical protein